MGKLKRTLALISTVAMLSTLVVMPSTAFANWHEAGMAFIADGGHTNLLAPLADTSVDRGETGYMLGSVLGLSDDYGDKCFTDDAGVDAGVVAMVERLCDLSIVKGKSAGLYAYADLPTKGEVGKMIVNGAHINPDKCELPAAYLADMPEWIITEATAHNADLTIAEALYCSGTMTGEGNGMSGSMNTAIYATVAVMMEREFGADAVVVPGEPPVVVGADVSVSIGDNPIDSDTLPKSATGVPVATWDFDTEGATLKSLTVHRFGVSSLPADHQVYLSVDGDRIGNGKSVNTTTNLAHFNNANIALPATVTLILDVGTTENTGEVGFELVDVDAVGAGDSVVSGDFPLKGEKFGLSTTAGGTVTMEKNGTVVDGTIGASNVKVSNFKLSVANEDGYLHRVGLYVTGTIDTDDLVDFKLYSVGESDPIATVDGVNSSEVANFQLDTPKHMLKGNTYNFYATASFSTGRTGDTVEVYLDENQDLWVKGGTYDYGMSVTSTAYDGGTCSVGTPTDCNAMTLEGGDVVLSGVNIANKNLAVNQKDAVVMTFNLYTEDEVTFNNFAFSLDTSAEGATEADGGLLSAAGVPTFTNIKISDGDHTWGPIDSDVLKNASPTGTAIVIGNDDAPGFYLFTDDLTMGMDGPETREFSITLNVENLAALADSTITATIEIDSTYPELKDAENKILSNASALVPTSDYVGDAFTIKADSLTVVRSAGVGSKTVVVGSSDVELASFSMGSGDASDTEITSIKVTGFIDDGGASNLFVAGADTVTFSEVVLSMDLYVGSVAPENKLNVSAKSADSSSGEAVFDNLVGDGWVIPAGETKTLIVAGDFSNNSAYDLDQLKVDFVDVSQDIIAVNEDSNAIESTSADIPNGGTVDTPGLFAQITMSAGGTLSADVPSNTASSEIVVAGTSGNEIATIKFTATEESMLISKMAIKNDYSTTVGDYDDNIDTVSVRYYTDEAQTAEETTECASSPTAGVYTCSGMNMMVPDPDLAGVDYAEATIVVDFNGVADDQADEGDLPALTLSLTHDFLATGMASNKSITEDVDDLLITDAALGNYGNAVNGYEDVQLDDAAFLATGTTLVVDDAGGAAPGSTNMVGAFLCLSENDNATCDVGEEQVYVTAVLTNSPAGNDTLTVIRGVNGTTAAVLTDNDTILVIPPSAALDTNHMQLQATDISVSNASSSREGSQNASETIMTFTIEANAAKDAKLGQGKTFATATEGTDTSGRFGVAAETVNDVDGSAMEITWTGAGEAASTIQYSTIGTDLSSYDRVSFWIFFEDLSASDALDASAVTLFTSTDATLAAGQGTALTISDPAEDTWTLVDMAIPTGTDSSDVVLGFQVNANTVAAGGATAANDTLNFDDIRLYNEKINVDLALNENWLSVTPTLATLKQNGTEVATAYVDLDAVVGSRTGQIQFTPILTFAEIIISGSDTFEVEMNTTAAFTNDSTATEQITATVDLGNISTAGDILWSDYSTTLNFLGVNATDKISTVSSY